MIFHSQQLKPNLGVSLIKELKDLCKENFKSLKKNQSRKTLDHVNPFHDFMMVELVL